jgi:MerR family transcriptional regulator, light-induced transcriptional regulator
MREHSPRGTRKKMELSAPDQKWFRPEVFEKTHQEITTLKARLPEDAVASLANEVIRRLCGRVRKLEVKALQPSPDHIENLARALISKDEGAGAQLVLDARASGMNMETVYLCYLAGAAQLLGEWWDNDIVTFVEVTIGTSRIYSIMRASNHLFVPKGKFSQKSAVFASSPNETHTLGIRMAADLFRKDGWDIDLMIGRSHDELVDEIDQSQHYLIGLSSAGRHSAAEMARLVIALRISKPTAFIMVSGQIVNDAEDIISVLGADGVANDFESARDVLEEFWERLNPARQTG